MREAARVARLSRRSVEAAAPEAVRYVVWDEDLKGFGLRVEPSGTKTFIVRYRVGGGRRGTLRQFKIGRYGKLTPDKAREHAERALAQAELGKDPQADREAERKTLTVRELCDLYLAEGIGAKKASTIALDKIRIERHIKPLIGNRKINTVTAGDIERLMHDIAAGKVRSADNPHTRGGQGAASRTVGLLSGIFIFAMKRRLCAENPAKGVKRFKDNRRERFLSPKELGELGDALTASEAAGANPHHIAILRLLALTGARKNEIARLRWSEVELDRARLNLADSKTGQKVIPLGAAAVELISKLPRGDGGFVFPDPRHEGEPVRGLDWFWVGVRSRAGLDGLRIHDLRHSFASIGLAAGQALPLIGKLLGHAHHGSTARYAHLADDPVRQAADRIAAQVAGALAGEQAELIPFGKGAA